MSLDVEKPFVEARLAATVLIVRDDPFEVLMVQRHAKAYYASALVFPGGVVEAEDANEAWLPHLHGGENLSTEERSFRIAACREVFEESALLLTAPAITLPLNDAALSGVNFLEFIRDHSLKLDLGALVDFAHWLTPEFAPKRFDTRFFLCRASAGDEAISDGVETVGLLWISPKAALQSVACGEKTIAFPTRMNLTRLAESSDCESALAAAKARPYFKVIPWVAETPNGRSVRIPLEAGYGVTGDDLAPI